MSEASRNWRSALDARLQLPYLRLVALAVVGVGVTLAVISFATAGRGKTAFGPPLGADFAGFFVAAQILERGEPEHLYDRNLHAQMYHELLPELDPGQIIPYVHPPFVAAVLRPLTWMGYPLAVFVWMVVFSACFYVLGVLYVLDACPELDKRYRALVLMLALAFEPFLFECWLGGQLSVFGFFSIALATSFLHRRRPFAAGLALGICFYKPTWLVLVLPGLLVARQWRVLGGMTVTGLLFGLVSLVAVGWDTCLNYLEVLLAFRQSTGGGDIAIRTWKYVDLNNNVRMLLGNTPWNLWIVAALGAGPFLWLMRAWWRWPRGTEEQRQMTWAVTLVLTPVLNLYVGVYDSIIVVIAAVIVVEQVLRSGRSLTGTGWAYVFLLVAVTPWFSQILAQTLHIQVYTWAILLMAWQIARYNPVPVPAPIVPDSRST